MCQPSVCELLSNDVCYVWRLPNLYEDTTFTIHRNRSAYLKVSAGLTESLYTIFVTINQLRVEIK